MNPIPEELAPSVVGGKVSHAHHIRHASLGVATVAELRAALVAGTLTAAVEKLADAVDATQKEVLRHGRCIAPVTSIPCPNTESVAK